MAKKPAKPIPSDGIKVDTVELLHRIQLAFHRAYRDKDDELEAAAESVLSAIIVVLRTRTAYVPSELGPYLDKVLE